MSKHTRAAIDVFIGKAQAYYDAILIDPYQARYGTLPSELDRAYSRVLMNAHDPSLREKVGSTMDLLLSALDAFSHWHSTGNFGIWRYQRQHGGSNPWEVSRSQIKECIRELNRLAPLLRGSTPLPERQQELWDLLVDGRCCSAKELSQKMGPGTSPENVRQLVSAIRQTGRTIIHVAGAGYCRSKPAAEALTVNSGSEPRLTSGSHPADGQTTLISTSSDLAGADASEKGCHEHRASSHRPAQSSCLQPAEGPAAG